MNSRHLWINWVLRWTSSHRWRTLEASMPCRLEEAAIYEPDLQDIAWSEGAGGRQDAGARSASTLHRDGVHPKLAHDHFTGPCGEGLQ